MKATVALQTELDGRKTEAAGDSTNRAQDTGDVRMKLRLRIAADPEEFFAHADKNHDGRISADEWQKACRGFLGNVDSALCHALFNEMDQGKDGWVSKDEFLEMRNAIRLFLHGAKCQELLVESLASLVAARWKAGGDDDTSVADKTTEILTELSVDELSKEVAVFLSRRLKERGDEVKREREERKKKLAELQVEEGEGKFAQLPTAAYGNKDDFHKGLEVLGLPDPNTLEELIKECQKKDDSNDEFEAWNSGKNVTNSSKELDFVVDPFDHFEGWQEQDPKDWKPKHQYGGKRILIRLEVFLHVLSATTGAKSATLFGDYKQAHTLDKSDPRWLHAKEVDMVKVVLCRFIKSQLTGLSLIKALRNAQDVNSPPSEKKANMRSENEERKANIRAEKIVKSLSKGLQDGGDWSASTCTFGFVLQTVLDNEAATEWELEALLDHFHARFASKPISESEVIAGRGYTGPLYVKMNGSLRLASKVFPEEWTEHLKNNTYTNLIYACNSLLSKFSEICIIPPGRKVYRGMSGVKLPACFIVCTEGGGRGGVEFGFLSTTTNMQVAVSYIGDKAMPVLFEIHVGDIDRGASLSFLSQYPNEDEILIPPLSYLEVIGEPFFENTNKGDVTVYPARINCNLKSQTIEEIKGHRQKEILAMLPYLESALRRDMSVLDEALTADLKEEAQVEKIDRLPEQYVLPNVESTEETDDPQLWFTTPAIAPETDVVLSCSWRDQGRGGQKGQLFVRRRRVGDALKLRVLLPSDDWHSVTSIAPHEQTQRVRISTADYSDGQSILLQLEFGYRVGAGGGHEIYLSDASLTVEASQSLVKGRIGEGDHVLSAHGLARKGVVEKDRVAVEPSRTRSGGTTARNQTG